MGVAPHRAWGKKAARPRNAQFGHAPFVEDFENPFSELRIGCLQASVLNDKDAERLVEILKRLGLLLEIVSLLLDFTQVVLGLLKGHLRVWVWGERVERGESASGR